jgi:hypothetical protein
MGKSNKSAAPAQASEHEPAQAGHNSERVIEKLTADYRAFRRKNIFDEGDLLIKIKAACEKYGDWGKWVEDVYVGSRDTADRHIAAARLAATFRSVRKLRVPATIIYELASIYFADKPADSDHYGAEDVKVAIPALAKADKVKGSALTETECWEAIKRAVQRVKWGNLSPATLSALEEIPADAPWAEAAIAALKKKRPKTGDAAEQIVTETHLKHVDNLYARHGRTLPRWLNSSSLTLLEAVPEERRTEIAAKLNPDQPLPADPEKLHDLVIALTQDQQSKPEPVNPKPEPVNPKPEPVNPKPVKPKPKPEPEPEPEAKRNDIGPNSEAERKRLAGDVERLQSEKRVLEIKIRGFESEIEDLKVELTTLKDSIGINATRRRSPRDLEKFIPKLGAMLRAIPMEHRIKHLQFLIALAKVSSEDVAELAKTLFATQEEAEADARAAIARQLQSKKQRSALVDQIKSAALKGAAAEAKKPKGRR